MANTAQQHRPQRDLASSVLRATWVVLSQRQVAVYRDAVVGWVMSTIIVINTHFSGHRVG